MTGVFAAGRENELPGTFCSAIRTESGRALSKRLRSGVRDGVRLGFCGVIGAVCWGVITRGGGAGVVERIAGDSVRRLGGFGKPGEGLLVRGAGVGVITGELGRPVSVSIRRPGVIPEPGEGVIVRGVAEALGGGVA